MSIAILAAGIRSSDTCEGFESRRGCSVYDYKATISKQRASTCSGSSGLCKPCREPVVYLSGIIACLSAPKRFDAGFDPKFVAYAMPRSHVLQHLKASILWRYLKTVSPYGNPYVHSLVLFENGISLWQPLSCFNELHLRYLPTRGTT